MTDLADAIRGACGTSDSMTISQMITNVGNIQSGIPIDSYNRPFERPEEYPDLDSIEIDENFEGLYLTYDLRLTPGYGWIGLYVRTRTAGAKYTMERGHLENGVFVADYSVEMTSENSDAATSGRFFRQDLDETNGTVQLWRMYTTDRIAVVAFCSKTADASNNPHIRLQPCVERVGQLGWVWEIASSGVSASNATTPTARAWATYWLRRCKVNFTGKAVVNRLGNAYANGFSLQEVDVSGWNTTSWEVITLQSTFYQCYNLQNLDLSYWDTSNWAVTTMRSMFTHCYMLKNIKMNWDTSNWAVNNLSGMFSDCYNIKVINSNWNTSNWAVTTLASMFQNCCAAKAINLNWNTNNWAVTAMSRTFAGCRNLLSADFSSWNTANWAVTTLQECFSNNICLSELDLSWNTSNWVVTNMQAMFNNCNSLRNIDMSSWDTSDWAVTTLENIFQNMYSIYDIDLTMWDTSNWPLANMSGMFRYDNHLHTVDMSTWNTTKFNLTNVRYMFESAMLCTEIKMPTMTYKGNATNIQDGYPTSPMLFYYNGYSISLAQDFSTAIMLTPDSLVNIFTNLPTVSSATTITIGAINKLKLTAEQLAIATNKGWTVA